MKRSLLLILFFITGLYIILGGVSDEIKDKVNHTNFFFEEANSMLEETNSLLEEANSHLEGISVKVDEANALLSELQTSEGDSVASSVPDNGV